MAVAVDISPEKDNGVLKEIIKEGTSDELPCEGCMVTVHYTGTFPNGTKFDSSRDRNEPFSFELGCQLVIKAWDIGVATMKKGEIAVFTCAPQYAYGSSGSFGDPQKIPPNSTLKFEIEMISWQLQDLSYLQDRSILKYLLVPGKIGTLPNDGDLVHVHLVGIYNDKVFEDREVQFCMTEGAEHGIIEGVEMALGSIVRHEKAKLFIKSQHAFKDKGNPELNIPPNADVEYIVELKKCEAGVKSWTLSPEELITQGEIFKEKGKRWFKQQNYNAALLMYFRLETFMNETKILRNNNEELEKKRRSLLLSAHLNSALCYLKINEYTKVKLTCNDALQIDPTNEKALFIRGQAYVRLASPELAIKDFQEVLRIEPSNTAATKQIIMLNNLMKQQVAKEKKLYGNMFEKFAREDKQREEEKLRQQPDVMRGTLGEWGQEERPGGRDATAFEKENPNILMLNANGTGEFQNM